MTLTCLPIFAWQMGRKLNNTEKNEAFLSETTFLPYFMTAWCVFFYQSVHFLPMLFIRTFITTLCFYNFCNNSVGKKMHTLPRCGLIFPFQMPVVLYLHNWSPLKPQNKLQKKSRALPSSSRRGLPKFWKNDLLANLFLLCILPQKREEFTPAF